MHPNLVDLIIKLKIILKSVYSHTIIPSFVFIILIFHVTRRRIRRPFYEDDTRNFLTVPKKDV
jgi:hypothetical protein